MRFLKIQALCLLCFNFAYSQQKVVFPKTQNEFVVIAHRGYHSDVPENTLESLRKGIELGVDYVEVDVRTTLEGVPVVMHDATVDRTTEGKGKVSEMSTIDFRQLVIKGTTLNPPTLSSILMEAKGKINLYLNIKDANPEKVMGLLDKYQMKDNVVIYSITPQIFEWKKLAPNIPIIASSPVNIKTPFEFEAFTLSFPVSILDGTIKIYDALLSQKLTEINIPIWLNTLDEEDNEDVWQRAIDLGIKALQTNKPKELMMFLHKSKLR
jgi:glycerophosphoryl diester phosphodiesterase